MMMMMMMIGHSLRRACLPTGGNCALITFITHCGDLKKLRNEYKLNFK